MLCNGILPSLIYTLSLHDALPISDRPLNTMYFPYIFVDAMYIKVREHNKVVSKAVYIATAINENNKRTFHGLDRMSTRLNSSHVAISYAVFCLKKKLLKIIRRINE